MKRFLKLLSRNQTAMVSCKLQCWFLCLSLLRGCSAFTCCEDKGVSQRFVTVHNNPACVTTDWYEWKATELGRWGCFFFACNFFLVRGVYFFNFYLLFLPFLAVCIFSHWVFIYGISSLLWWSVPSTAQEDSPGYLKKRGCSSKKNNQVL